MDLDKISTKYKVKKLDVSNFQNILNLYLTNLEFYEHRPLTATTEGIIENMNASSIGKNRTDKLYIGYFEEDKLMGILDLSFDYPKKGNAYIGLFMLHKNFQGKGIGTEIINELISYLKENGYTSMSLAYAKTNESAKNFWLKNDFTLTDIEKINDNYVAVLMEKDL